MESAEVLLECGMPMEVGQLRSRLCQRLMQLVLAGMFVGMLTYSMVIGLQSAKRATFISLDRNAGDCSRELTPTVSGTFSIDEDGRWSTDPRYDTTKEIVRVTFKDFPTRKYSEAIQAAGARVREFVNDDTTVLSLMETLLVTMTWRYEYESGGGSVVFSIAADPGAVFDGKTLYIGVAGCPSAGTLVDGTLYDYHVDQDGAKTRLTWRKDAFTACVRGAYGKSPSDVLGSMLTGAPVVDSERLLDIDWNSVAFAAALNNHVETPESLGLDELNASLFNFFRNDIEDDDDDDVGTSDYNGDDYYYFYFYDDDDTDEDDDTPVFDSPTAWTEFMASMNFNNWTATDNYTALCPKQIPADFDLWANNESSVRFFTDARYPGMDPLACLNTTQSGWVCSVVLGDVHAYPYVELWDAECNYCSPTLECSDGDDFQADFTGGFFLKSVYAGPFLSHTYADRADYWYQPRSIRSEKASLSNLVRLASFGLQNNPSERVAQKSACALEFEGSLFVAFNAYEGDANAVSLNFGGNTAKPTTYHCKKDWAETAMRAVDGVAKYDDGPLVLFENYYVCKKKLRDRWFEAVGVGFANARLLFLIASVFLTTIILRLISVTKKEWLEDEVFVAESEVQDEQVRSLREKKKLERDERSRLLLRRENNEESVTNTRDDDDDDDDV